MTAKLFRPQIVAISGHKFNGKDTAAKPLIEELGFVQVNMAEGLKQVLALALRVDIKYFNDPALKETVHEPSGKTYRWWAQQAGTNWFRTAWSDVWIHWWKTEVHDKNLGKVVVTDIRFPNELEAVTRLAGGTECSFRVVNPYKINDDTHESEQHISKLPVKFVIANDDDIPTLQKRSVQVVSQHFGI